MLFRKIESLIENHLQSDSKKILLIDGARQVGKTYIIRHVGHKLFENFIEINMVEDSIGPRLFAETKTVEDFYLQVSMLEGSKMKQKDNTLIFIDEIQMSSLIGGEDGGYDNFREFIGDPEAVDNAVAERMLLEALYKALDQLSESDCDLIRALYFEGKTLSEYGEEKGCAISALSERRKRILRDLKKVLKNFAE